MRNFSECFLRLAGLLEGAAMTENIRYIEDSIYQQINQVDMLRLMCLLSLVKDGLSPEVYENLKTIYLQVCSQYTLEEPHTHSKTYA